MATRCKLSSRIWEMKGDGRPSMTITASISPLCNFPSAIRRSENNFCFDAGLFEDVQGGNKRPGARKIDTYDLTVEFFEAVDRLCRNDMKFLGIELGNIGKFPVYIGDVTLTILNVIDNIRTHDC